MRKSLLVILLIVLATAGGYGIRRAYRRPAMPDVASFKDVDFRYDDSVSLQETYAAFDMEQFETVEASLGRMIRIEKDSTRQTPFLSFLSVVGQPEHFDRCRQWSERHPGSAFAWMTLGDAYKQVGYGYAYGKYPEEIKSNPPQQFIENVLKAEECYLKAQKIDPDLAYAPAGLIGVDMLLNRGREVMEAHYQRSVRDDYACPAPYLMKAEFLKPEWYGTWEEYRDYVFETSRKFPPNTLIPVLLIMGYHLKCVQHFNNPDYFAAPEVWRDIQTMLEAYLAANPTHYAVRSLYFKLAVQYAHKDIALREAHILRGQWGPLWRWGAFKSEAVYNETIIKLTERPAAEPPEGESAP